MAEAYQVAAQADAIAHLEAYALWAWMVRQGGPWDPKWQIINTYGDLGYWVKLGDEYEYYYDVWGNVMYGYLGKALGFSEEELFHGAGLEQIGSDVGYAFKYGDLTRLPHPRINVEGLAAFDHPQDRTGIEIGITLWEQHRTDFTPEDLERAIIRHREWLERRLPLSP
ncbi:MAG: polymorphic toxin type 44 domain-containing protein [Thermoflexus sp.]